MNDTFRPFARPLYVMLKPIGAICNLRCDYCYYLEKTQLYPENSKFAMSDSILEEFTKQYLASQSSQQVMFTWHGGEALLRNIEFYKKALKYQKVYGRGFHIDNSLQTNGVLLTDEWCRFLKDNNFLIGISIDGPEHCHDHYRKYSNGEGSFSKVMRGLELLKKYKIEYNILSVVNDYNVDYPEECYEFYKSTGTEFIQYIPLVEHTKGVADSRSVPPGKWGDFLIRTFERWRKTDVGKIYIQQFDASLSSWVGVSPPVCIFAERCGHAGVLEFNGDVYSCDHFVLPEYKLGNIRTEKLTNMMFSSRQQKFGSMKTRSLPQKCIRCTYKFACHGECPKNRFVESHTGEPAINYLCEGYLKYFNHVAPYMEFMKNELKHQRSPANVMRVN